MTNATLAMLASVRRAVVFLCWIGSVFLSFILATPLGWGMQWSDYDLTEQIVLSVLLGAPLIVLVLAIAIWLKRRRKAFPDILLLIAPATQIAYLAFHALT